MLVSSLIDSSTVSWKAEVVEELFLPMDAEVIRSIPLSTHRLDDFWAWHYEKNGLLSVRSAYRMLVLTKKRREDWLQGRSGGSEAVQEGRSWQRLWRAQVPSKLRVFLWRLAQQSLPTGNVRCHRHMSPTSSCSVCGEEDSWRHSLINCAMARTVWALADEEITEHVSMNEDPYAKQWLFVMMETLSRDDFARVVVTLWSIWYARRKLIHEGEF
jgi:hypothetical protein